MRFRPLQLAHGILALLILHSSVAQDVATATENGIVAASGAPAATQSVSYSILGGGAINGATATSRDAIVTPSQTDASIMSEGGSNNTKNNEHKSTIPAIIGVVIAVLFAVGGAIVFAVVMHKRKRQQVSRAKRKSIMEVEFAAWKPELQLAAIDKHANIGYFDLAKPLPVVTDKEQPPKPVEEDTLSRSSTIIADAAEIAQINRKASTHQKKRKKSREQYRARNHALQILITNEDNRTTALPTSPVASNPSTPADPGPVSPRSCPDGNGDLFARRLSKI